MVGDHRCGNVRPFDRTIPVTFLFFIWLGYLLIGKREADLSLLLALEVDDSENDKAKCLDTEYDT